MWRYVPVAKKFTSLQRLMASKAGFELDKALFPDRQYNYCHPGSPQHLAWFKQQDFPLTTQNQVGQVVKVIASWHKLPLPVADKEAVCSKLKTEILAGSKGPCHEGTRSLFMPIERTSKSRNICFERHHT
jgi:hypothetical protein